MSDDEGNDLDPQLLEKVQKLIAFNLSSRRQLRTAADAVDHPNLSRLFAAIADERSSQAHELQGYVAATGETPRSEEDLNSTARELILKIREALEGGDPKVVLSEAERAEEAISARYEELLDGTSRQPIHDVLERQYRTVRRQHDVVRDLRDAFFH